MSEAPGRRATEEWIRVINEGKGYSGIDAETYRENLRKTEDYAFFGVLKRYAKEGCAALEAGCGWAYSSFALANCGVKATALDVSEKLVGDLVKMRDALGRPPKGSVEPVVGDMFCLDRLNRRFNLVFHDGTYQHFLDAKERQAILEQIKNSLESGGHYAVAVPNLWNPAFRFVLDARMPAMHRFSVEALAAELEAQGFRVLEKGFMFVNAGFEQWLKRRWMVGPVKMADRFFRVAPSFLKRWMAAHIYCVAKKG